MKKLIILLLIPLFSFGQDLNFNAKLFKGNQSPMFKNIEEFAKDKWGEDNEKIIRTINKQADALFDYFRLPASSDFNIKFFKLAVQYNRTNTDEPFEAMNAAEILECCKVNWVKALEEYNDLIEKAYY